MPEYNKDFVRPKVKGNRKKLTAWKIAALKADMSFEEWASCILDEAALGRCVCSTKQTVSNKPITEIK